VCLSVRDNIFGTTRLIFTNFFLLVAYGRGSVLSWRRSDKLCTSGFMDDVVFTLNISSLGLWFTSPAGWLPRTRISSETLRSVIEYGLALPFFFFYFIANIYPINRLQTTASSVQAIASRHLAVRGGVFVARKFNISFSTYFQKIANKPHHRQSNQSMYGLRRKVDAYHRTLPQVCAWSFGEAWSNLLTHYIQKIIWCVYCVIISYER